MAGASDKSNPRKHVKRAPRVNGPFSGRRVGELTTDLSIHDLSITGCLIESFHEVQPGRRLTLEIDVPEGTITLAAETVYTRADYGYAVKFVDVSPQVRVVLARTVFHRLSKGKAAT